MIKVDTKTHPAVMNHTPGPQMWFFLIFLIFHRNKHQPIPTLDSKNTLGEGMTSGKP